MGWFQLIPWIIATISAVVGALGLKRAAIIRKVADVLVDAIERGPRETTSVLKRQVQGRATRARVENRLNRIVKERTQ